MCVSDFGCVLVCVCMCVRACVSHNDLSPVGSIVRGSLALVLQTHEHVKIWIRVQHLLFTNVLYNRIQCVMQLLLDAVKLQTQRARCPLPVEPLQSTVDKTRALT